MAMARPYNSYATAVRMGIGRILPRFGDTDFPGAVRSVD